MFYHFDNFDYSQGFQNVDDATPVQQGLIKFVKKFDEEMQVRNE